MIAGGLAGTMEHTAMYPIDTIKTRMQALGQPVQGVGSARVQLRRNYSLPDAWGVVALFLCLHMEHLCVQCGCVCL